MPIIRKRLLLGCVLAALLGFVGGFPLGYALYQSQATAGEVQQ